MLLLPIDGAVVSVVPHDVQQNKSKMNCLRQFGRISFHNRRCLSQFSSVNIFDNKIKRLQLNRALSDSESNIYDYVKDEVAYRVADRVFDIKR